MRFTTFTYRTAFNIVLQHEVETYRIFIRYPSELTRDNCVKVSKKRKRIEERAFRERGIRFKPRVLV